MKFYFLLQSFETWARNLIIKEGGGQAFQFRPTGWGDGLDMYQQLQDGFESMRAILPI